MNDIVICTDRITPAHPLSTFFSQLQRLYYLFLFLCALAMLRYNTRSSPEDAAVFEKDFPDPYIMHPDWLLRKVGSLMIDENAGHNSLLQPLLIR